MNDQYNKEWLSFIRHKRFRPSTVSVYTSSVEWFLNKCGNKNPVELSYHEIRTILLEVENKNTVNNTITAIRQFYLRVLNRELDWKQLPYTVKHRKVQPIYIREDLLKVLNAVTNEKQKAILALIIDCGLRISEPCNIVIADCNSKERRIVLRSAKGDLDRIIFPAQFVWDLIKDYWNKWKKQLSDKFLFDGQIKGNPYTPESIRETLKRYCKITGVKYLGAHSIRRFTGTWWIENDVPLPVAAQKMGHSSSRTLEKHYLIHSHSYLKNVPSPLA